MSNMQSSGQPSSHKKMFLLALDSTPLTFLQDNISKLPNIGALLRSGRTVETGTSADLLSASPWPTFASGLMPGEQGHYFPLQWDASAMKFIPIKEKSLMFKPFWDDLARGGVETIVFDVMAVPLHDDAPGLQVINWNTQSNFAPSSNRADVLKTIQRNFGKKPIGDEIPVKKSRQSARRRSRPAHPVNAEKDGRNPVGHARVRLAMLHHRLLRGPSRRPQPLADMGGFRLRSARGCDARRLSRDRCPDRPPARRA